MKDFTWAEALVGPLHQCAFDGQTHICDPAAVCAAWQQVRISQIQGSGGRTVMNTFLLDNKYTIGIIMGMLFGMLARLSMLRTDYRQYPTHPHGKIIHLSLGIIAAALGSVAVPALLKKDYTAVTFLTVAAQQFRDVRNMERDTLTKIDGMELVQRGATYIEGIAMVFEGRNYLVIMSSFVTSFAAITLNWYLGLAVGVLSLIVVHLLRAGKSLSHIATVKEAPVRQEGADLYVGDIYIMNVV